jgi:hypothetical protein
MEHLSVEEQREVEVTVVKWNTEGPPNEDKVR